MLNQRPKQTAYTADELEEFLADLDVFLRENLAKTKVEVAEDVLGAVRAGVKEYGLDAARYVSQEVGVREGGRLPRSGMKASKIILKRNVAKLRELGAARKDAAAKEKEAKEA